MLCKNPLYLKIYNTHKSNIFSNSKQTDWFYNYEFFYCLREIF